ncbi:hypothetical protein Tco_0169559 [Tanacetum coccineum]
MYVASLRNSENYKVQPYQYASPSKQILKSKANSYPPCTHCGFNDHRRDDCRNYLECAICGSYDHFTSRHNRVILVRGGVLAESSQSSESLVGVSCTNYGSNVQSTTDHNDFEHFKQETHQGAHLVLGQWMLKEYEWCQQLSTQICGAARCPVFIIIKDHLGKFDAKTDDGYLGHSFVFKAFRVFNTRRQQIEETCHVTFDKSMEALRFTNTSVDEIRINDSYRYHPDEFLHKDDPSKQYQANFDISYYITPHNRLLNELTNDTHVLEVITPNEQNTPHTKDVKGPPDLINTEGMQVQEVQNELINNQPTEEPLGNNIKTSVSITKLSVPKVVQSQITHHASTSSHHAPQDRWSRDKHIEPINNIGEPTEGMLTRSMAAKLTPVSTSECLFVDFLFEIEPKKVFVILKQPRWVDAMQEE